MRVLRLLYWGMTIHPLTAILSAADAHNWVLAQANPLLPPEDEASEACWGRRLVEAIYWLGEKPCVAQLGSSAPDLSSPETLFRHSFLASSRIAGLPVAERLCLGVSGPCPMIAGNHRVVDMTADNVEGLKGWVGGVPLAVVQKAFAQLPDSFHKPLHVPFGDALSEYVDNSDWVREIRAAELDRVIPEPSPPRAAGPRF